MPLVDRFKFVTKGRWLTQICERYAKNKTNDLQLAFFNGDVSSKATPPPPQLLMRARPQGFESWENVWGAWNMIVPRDGEALRRVGTMLRYWSRMPTPESSFLHSADW